MEKAKHKHNSGLMFNSSKKHLFLDSMRYLRGALAQLEECSTPGQRVVNSRLVVGTVLCP